MEWYQKLLEFASKEYDFDINTFKIREVSKFNDPSLEMFTFSKNGKEYMIDFEPDYLPERRQTRAELDFIYYLAENNVNVAAPLKTVNGELGVSARKIGENINITAFEMASGEFWDKNEPNKWNNMIFFNWGKIMGDMHRLAKEYKSANKYNVPDIFNNTYQNWGSYFDRFKVYPAVYKISQDLLGEIADLPKDRDSYGLIHCDLHPYNFYIDGDKLTVFDFNDNIYAWFALDIAIGLFHGLDWSGKDDFGNDFTNAIVENFLKGYLSSNQLSGFWLSKIPIFMKYRQICFLGAIDDNYKKEWIYNIENDILFDGYDSKSITDLIGKTGRN